MSKLIAIKTARDVPAHLKDTPIGHLIAYQNFDMPFRKYDNAELLVAMCMDNRKQLRIPENFAYILRTGGANVRNGEFKVSYAVAIGGVQWMALIAHNNCGMVHLAGRREAFIDGLVKNAGWERARAEEHFNGFASLFEIENEIEFVVEESVRLNARYPKLNVVPLYYKLEDNLLYVIEK
jgi:carbonic anhydrase